MIRFRTFSQVVFLAVFVGLLVTGKAQFWLAFVFASILLSSLFGRYYCGWACPINTLMRPTAWLARKFGLARKPVSGLLKTEKPRYIVLLVFLVGLSYTVYSITQGKKFPLPLIVIPFGLISTIIFSSNAWHRYLCPWGTLFSLTGRFSRLGYKNKINCSDCGKCVKVCPADTVKKLGNKNYNYDMTNCLLCFDCQSQCPQKAISFGKVKSDNYTAEKESVTKMS